MRHNFDKTDLGALKGQMMNLDIPEVTEEERQKARLTVCDRLGDATLARDMLDALGLLT